MNRIISVKDKTVEFVKGHKKTAAAVAVGLLAVVGGVVAAKQRRPQ